MSYIILASVVFILAFAFGYVLGQMDATVAFATGRVKRTNVVSGGVQQTNVVSGGDVIAVSTSHQNYRKDLDWVKANRTLYPGEWVALCDGVLVDHCRHRSTLEASVTATGYHGRTLVVRMEG